MSKRLFLCEHKRGTGEKETLDFPFEVKAGSIADDGNFEGYGSTFNGEPDSYRDIVAPGAFRETIKHGGRNKNGINLLWQHDSRSPLGVWHSLVEDSKGLMCKGQVEPSATPGGIPVYKEMKMGAIRGLSIGFTPIKYDIDSKTDIRTLHEVELWEISLVTFPANVRATITSVKKVWEHQTPRELESALRDAGLSIREAKWIASACKDHLNQREVGAAANAALLAELRKVNQTFEIFKKIKTN